MNILSVENASFAVGHVALLDKTSFQLDSGEKIGLIGRNGAGKSSFLKILAGVQKLDDGQIIVQNNLKIVYVPQESFFDKETKRSRFQNVKYLNVAKREPIDTKHLKYRAGLLDAIKEEYSFAVANHIEAYLAIRDLHAKADLSNKVIITNTEAHSVEVDRNTVVEVRATIQVKDRETNEKVLILKFVAPYAEIQESPLGASTNSYCKVYSNRQKYYVQLEEVLNELYNELKAGIA